MENSEKTGERKNEHHNKKEKMYIYYRKETEPDSSFVTPNFMDEKKTGPQTDTGLYIYYIFSFFLFIRV